MHFSIKLVLIALAVSVTIGAPARAQGREPQTELLGVDAAGSGLRTAPLLADRPGLDTGNVLNAYPDFHGRFGPYRADAATGRALNASGVDRDGFGRHGLDDLGETRAQLEARLTGSRDLEGFTRYPDGRRVDIEGFDPQGKTLRREDRGQYLDRLSARPDWKSQLAAAR